VLKEATEKKKNDFKPFYDMSIFFERSRLAMDLTPPDINAHHSVIEEMRIQLFGAFRDNETTNKVITWCDSETRQSSPHEKRTKALQTLCEYYTRPHHAAPPVVA
jgi:hypothetical protein